MADCNNDESVRDWFSEYTCQFVLDLRQQIDTQAAQIKLLAAAVLGLTALLVTLIVTGA